MLPNVPILSTPSNGAMPSDENPGTPIFVVPGVTTVVPVGPKTVKSASPPLQPEKISPVASLISRSGSQAIGPKSAVSTKSINPPLKRSIRRKPVVFLYSAANTEKPLSLR